MIVLSAGIAIYAVSLVVMLAAGMMLEEKNEHAKFACVAGWVFAAIALALLVLA